MRFLGLGLEDVVPDATTVWLFREALSRANLVKALFDRFNGYLNAKGYMEPPKLLRYKNHISVDRKHKLIRRTPRRMPRCMTAKRLMRCSIRPTRATRCGPTVPTGQSRPKPSSGRRATRAAFIAALLATLPFASASKLPHHALEGPRTRRTRVCGSRERHGRQARAHHPFYFTLPRTTRSR
jgi:Transposase domain (DUF772)